MKVKFVCISDTHEQHNKITVPDGDILLFAGDMSYRGDRDAIEQFNDWLGTLPHKHKVVIAGNHDWLFERNPLLAESLITNAIYLNDSGVNLMGFNIWGSPVQPEFCNWAFNRKRGADISNHWDKIPTHTDVLLVHGPPRGIGDQACPERHTECLGCDDLWNTIEYRLDNLKLCVFGHIHGGSGITRFGNGPYFVNASVVDEAYHPNGKTYEVTIER